MNIQKGVEKCPPDVLGSFIDLVSKALSTRSPLLETIVEDIELAIDMLHAIRPGVAEFKAFEGALHFRLGNWSDALPIFSELVKRSKCGFEARSQLLYCRQATGDPSWREDAEQFLAEDSPVGAKRYIRAVLAKDDLENARQEARRTGVFVLPASVIAIQEDAAKREETLAPDGVGLQAVDPGAFFVQSMQYLRM